MKKIIFQGPYRFLKHGGLPSVFASDIKNKQGVYLWTVPFKNKELIYYVGMTASQTFSKRFIQHIKGYLSGEYGINEPEDLRKGKRVRIWDGLWRGADIEEFIKRHAELFPKIVNLLQTYRIYGAVIDRDKRFIERVEFAIAKHLYDQKGIIGNFQEPEIRYRGRREDEKPLVVSLEYNTKIIGLSQTLEV